MVLEIPNALTFSLYAFGRKLCLQASDYIIDKKVTCLFFQFRKKASNLRKSSSQRDVLRVLASLLLRER